MTTFQIETNDRNAIQEIKDFVSERFHIQVKVISKADKLEQKTKGKWGNFAKRMSGLTTPEITEHIQKTGEEMRESFEFRNLAVNK